MSKPSWIRPPLRGAWNSPTGPRSPCGPRTGKTWRKYSIPPSLAPGATPATATAGPPQRQPTATRNQQPPRRRSRVSSVVRDDAVDDVVLRRLVRSHEVVTFGVFGDL